MRTRLLTIALAAGIALPASAQIRPSEHGSVTQRVNAATLTLEYDRPGARGRSLFGDGSVVQWGETWTPGANWATTIELDADVRVESRPLPKGKYSVWLIPRAAPAPWSLVFARTARRFHTRPPATDDEQLRIPVHPEQGMYMETLAWYFPVVTPAGATLRMHWGTTFVPVQVQVETPPREPMRADQRPLYAGNYRMHVAPGAGRPASDVDLAVRDVNGVLTLESTPRDVLGGPVELVLVSDHRFYAALPATGTLRGQVYADPGVLFVFGPADGHARTIQMLGYDNSIIGRGELR